MSDDKPHMILARKTDELREKIETVETAIESLALGVSAQVSFSVGEALSWQKLGGKWSLCVVRDGKDPVALVSSSRATRVKAVPLFPALIEALHTAVEHDLQEVEGALTTIDGFLSAFKVAAE